MLFYDWSFKTVYGVNRLIQADSLTPRNRLERKKGLLGVETHGYMYIVRQQYKEKRKICICSQYMLPSAEDGSTNLY